MDQELKIFIEHLQKIQKPLNKTFDLGLIVKEPKSKIRSEKIFETITKIIDAEKIVYDSSILDEDIIKRIIKAFQNKKWVFLEIKKDISSVLLNQLKNLSNHNILQLIDYQGEDVFELPMPKESRVIVFAERDFIENKISYPHFYTLFGPVLAL